MKNNILKYQEPTKYKTGDKVSLLPIHPYGGVSMPLDGYFVTGVSETGIAKVGVIVNGKSDELAFYDTELTLIS